MHPAIELLRGAVDGMWRVMRVVHAYYALLECAESRLSGIPDALSPLAEGKDRR